jgi:diguanylate cyclase (GGDEF)-like protein
MRHRVLVIDDALPLHQLIKVHLEDQGLEIHSAHNGETGLDLAFRIRPSLILLDVDMSPMDGFEVCRRLKSNENTASIPVLFLTADFQTQDKIKALDLGAVDYITKPFKVEELLARIRVSLRVRQEIDERAMVDDLTGLWNRAYFEDHLPAHLASSKRTGQPLSCIIANVDELGRINDRHGRWVGDELLRSVGRTLLGECRPEDAVCSCGDGTFALLVPGMDRLAASRLADRLCAKVQERPITTNGVQVDVSCSFGVADTVIMGEESLYDRAKSALTRAKQNGRSCVSIARPSRQHARPAA